MIINRSITFSPHVRKNKNTTIFPLRMRISYEGYEKDIPTGIKVDITTFDKNKQAVIDGQDAGKINAEIARLKAKAEELFTKFELVEKRVPVPDELKKLLSEKKSEVKTEIASATIYPYYDKFTRITGKKNGWKQATWDKYKYLRGNLIIFDPELRFKDIDENKMLSLLQFFFGEEMMNATIDKYLSMFRTFLRWTKKEKLYQGDQHETFLPRLKGRDNAYHQVIFLEWDELMKLKDMKFEQAQLHLEQSRDCFLFQCFTGLRYSDLFNILRIDVKKDSFSFVSVKGDERLVIELNKYSRKILNKYEGVEISKGKALPVISNQKMNDNLKVICKMAGMTEPIRQVIYRANERKEIIAPKYTFIGTHCGRRSFIVNALYLGIASEVIMKWTGHADFRAMKPYVAIVDKLKEKEMKKFNR